MKGFICVLCCCLFSNVVGTDVDYLNNVCDVSNVYVGTSRRLESSTALYYKNSMSCFYHVHVPTGKQVLLLVRYFYLETEVKNACVDFVNIHDGTSTTDTALNSSPLCAEAAANNYTSTGTDMTIYFETDSSGVRRGFDFTFVAITTGTCGTDQFSCNTTGVCIDNSLACNIYDECGDNSDESNCPSTTYNFASDDNAGLIAGLCIGLLALVLIIVIIGYCLWRNNRWRVFSDRPITAKKITHQEMTYATTYPVTKVYYKERVQEYYKDTEKPPILKFEEDTGKQ